MSALFAILGWMLFGLVAGAIARLAVPGPQPIGVLWTSLLGIAGSVVGGALTWAVTGSPMEPAGWIMSIVGAALVLVLFCRVQPRQT